MAEINGADSDSEDDLMGMFQERVSLDDVFYFTDIIVNESTVTFYYNFCREAFFESTLVLSSETFEYNIRECPGAMQIIFCIGMCTLSWYWMGFNTESVVVEREVCEKCRVSESMMPFWDDLFNQVSLEYIFVNKLPQRKLKFILKLPVQDFDTEPEWHHMDPKYSCENSVIIPIGGTWNNCVCMLPF
jgi:hypothetical protein